ncbi:LysR family transcriptional regulator [Nibricoccus sp. IMCC34717]|uniref:LysR family transcriptional regulator n=1 Tax=Nibricoccus sp. IMCC34717 TaxID=3034021 RepID=UPI0038510EFA
MSFLNYHHLRYFHAVAREGSLARASAKLNLSTPALSIQLKQLEENLGHKLFDRQRSGWTLTEAGRLALEYAETIFRAGDELRGVLQQGAPTGQRTLRVGAVATLSRNFQIAFVEPIVKDPSVSLVLRSGDLRELLQQLQAHTIDLVLSNQAVRRDSDHAWHSHLLAQQPVGLFGGKAWRKRKFKFPADCHNVPLILPSHASDVRAAFDRLMDQHSVRPRIAAEVDDMAMLRLLVRSSEGLALVPRVVVRDEFERGELTEVHHITQIQESFYAITPSRRFPNPLVRELVQEMQLTR